jgi:hypothetical protein
MYNLFVVTGFTSLTYCMLLLRMKPCIFPKTISDILLPICIRIVHAFNILSYICAFTASRFSVMQWIQFLSDKTVGVNSCNHAKLRQLLDTVVCLLRKIKVNRCFMLISCFAYSSTLKMEAICSSETLVDFRQTTRRYISVMRTHHSHGCEKRKSNTSLL